MINTFDAIVIGGGMLGSAQTRKSNPKSNPELGVTGIN